MFFSNRSLKIAESYIFRKWQPAKINPKIIISGNWLKNAGFEPGEQINIEVHQNKLIITKP